MLTLRDVVLAELDKWHGEGLISADHHATLRARSLADPSLDAPAAPSRQERGTQAANWLQLVGGLLLGAAMVALVSFLDMPTDQAPIALLALGAAAALGGITLYLRQRDARVGLADAALAAGLVALSVSPFIGDEAGRSVYGLVTMGLAVGALLVRRGQGPLAVLSGAAFTLGSLAATRPEFFGNATDYAALEWWASLLGFSFVLLVFRRETWSNVASGLMMGPHAIAFIMWLDAAGLRGSRNVELAVGGYFALALTLGIWLGVRGLVAGAAAALTIDAVVFAYDLGGAGNALVLLLVLGGVLVWQAEFIRRYFGRRKGGLGGSPPRVVDP
ncbi:MAG: hypothetical protein WDA16_00795 [Candidatus Thermoplasmatota archaeon]